MNTIYNNRKKLLSRYYYVTRFQEKNHAHEDSKQIGLMNPKCPLTLQVATGFSQEG